MAFDWKEFPALEEDLGAIREAIRAELRAAGGLVREAVEPVCEAGGKMLRPALLCACARLGAFEPEKFRRLGAALELLHVASLIHDDVIDGAATRRGVPSAHVRVGPRAAVIAGDWLFSRCRDLAAELADSRRVRLIVRGIGRLCGAELEQDSSRFVPSASVRAYSRRVLGKTATLFMLACQTGAAESGAGPALEELARRAGFNLGMAFQIMDDVLDYEGDGARMGKPVGGDLAEGACTLPLVLALKARAALGQAFRRLADSSLELERLRAEVRATGSIDASKARAALYSGRAAREASRMPPGLARDFIEALAPALMARAE